MLELNETNVAEFTKHGKFLLMFSADWCPLCPMVTGILKELEQTDREMFQFAKIDFDTSPKAVKAYGVAGVPIVLAVKDGAVLHGWAGLTDAGVYRDIVRNVLNTKKTENQVAGKVYAAADSSHALN